MIKTHAKGSAHKRQPPKQPVGSRSCKKSPPSLFPSARPSVYLSIVQGRTVSVLPCLKPTVAADS